MCNEPSRAFWIIPPPLMEMQGGELLLPPRPGGNLTLSSSDAAPIFMLKSFPELLMYQHARQGLLDGLDTRAVLSSGLVCTYTGRKLGLSHRDLVAATTANAASAFASDLHGSQRTTICTHVYVCAKSFGYYWIYNPSSFLTNTHLHQQLSFA